VYYQIAQDGLMFRWFNHLHPTFHTPDRAIILQAIWSSVLVATGSYRALFTRVIYTEWIFFALLAVGVILLRRRPGYAPAWRMPLVPLAPIVFVVVSLLIVVNQIRADIGNSTIGLLIVASGIPAYYFLARNRASTNP
jgi:APA family basic amino acid/polyamine antiporter